MAAYGYRVCVNQNGWLWMPTGHKHRLGMPTGHMDQGKCLLKKLKFRGSHKVYAHAGNATRALINVYGMLPLRKWSDCACPQGIWVSSAAYHVSTIVMPEYKKKMGGGWWWVSLQAIPKTIGHMGHNMEMWGFGVQTGHIRLLGMPTGHIGIAHRAHGWPLVEGEGHTDVHRVYGSDGTQYGNVRIGSTHEAHTLAGNTYGA